MGLTTKNKLIVAGIVLLILLIIGIVIYRSGKKKGGVNISAPIVDNPNNPGSNNNPAISSSDLAVLVDLIYRDMEGLNISHDTDLWSSKVLTLGDTDFARLYNEFNSEYQKDSGETLTQWVRGELVHNTPFVGGTWKAIRETLLTRFSKLNLI